MLNKAILLTNAHGPGADGLGVPAPLVRVGGIPLIKRSLMALEQQGIHEIIVVLGHRGDEIRRYVSADGDIHAHLTFIETEDGERCDGRSLVKAREFVDAPALVLSSQLLFSPDMLAPFADQLPFPEDATLLVDRKLRRVYDLPAALKVRTHGERIVDLGPGLKEFDAVAVGIAMVQPEYLASLDETGVVGLSFSSLLRRALHQRLLRAQDVNGSQWQEVFSHETRLHADWLLRAYGDDLGGHREGPPQASSSRDPKRTLSYIEGLLSEKNARHYVLFNPGPVLTSPRVKSALVHHDVCHRDSDYSLILRRLQRKLRRVCKGGPEHDIVLFSGSGTASMEAVLSSCIPPEGKLLVVSNGAFGERFAEIAQVHHIPTVHLRRAWGEIIDPVDVERTIETTPGIVAAIMCHHETSVGILNPVHEIGAICRGHDLLFFVDAISSLAGEDLDVRRDNIDILISSANKCLHGISGVSFVCVSARVWPRIEDLPPRVYYLDLKRYHRISKAISQTPFTPAVSNFFALDAALDDLLAEGVDNRVRHYRELNTRIREALTRMGLRRMSQTGHESHSITTVETPDYIPFSELYEEMKRRGYIIYACKDHLQDRFFQIANMGELSEEMVAGFLDTLEHVLAEAAERRHKVLPLERRTAASTSN